MNSVENIWAGDITYRLTEDADRVSEVIDNTAQDTIPCTLQLLAVILYMCYLDWSLTVSTFVLAPLIILSVNSFGKRVLIASEKSQESTSNLAGLIGESINGMSTIRALIVDIPFIDSPIKPAKLLVDSWLFSDAIKTLFPKLLTERIINGAKTNVDTVSDQSK